MYMHKFLQAAGKARRHLQACVTFTHILCHTPDSIEPDIEGISRKQMGCFYVLDALRKSFGTWAPLDGGWIIHLDQDRPLETPLEIVSLVQN